MKRHVRALIQAIESRMNRNDVLWGAEIGVWRGGMSAELLGHFPNLILYMVDPWRPTGEKSSMYDKSQAEMDTAKREAMDATEYALPRRTILEMDSVEATTYVLDHILDFVFIDANHMYEGVAPDIRAWFPKVKKGRIVAGHDYGGVGDRRKGWGIKRAVDEFCEEYHFKLERVRHLVWWFQK